MKPVVSIYQGKVMIECAAWELILLSAAFIALVALLVWLVFHYRGLVAKCRAERTRDIERMRSNFFTNLARLHTDITMADAVVDPHCPENGRPNEKPVPFADEDNRGNAAFINRLVLAVGTHLDDSAWFPAGLAREMCLSESQLNRKLKAMTGHTICSFVMWMRLDRAKHMLSNGNAKGTSVKEVAYTCGFNSLPYFTRSFKSEFGVTPSRFAQGG